MAVIKQTNFRNGAAAGGVFDLGDLRRDAESALAEARAEAARIVADAQREAARLRTSAREEGLAAGRAEGHAAGLAEGRAAGEATGRAEAAAAHDEGLRALEETFSSEFLRWIAVRDERLREAERGLAGIAVAIAERIVAEHVRADPAFVARSVERAVALFARATRVRVEIAPEDEALVSEALPNLRAALPAGSEIELAPRAGIGRGGCVIRSGEGSVDARIETLFRRMHGGLIGDAPVDADAAAMADMTKTPAADAEAMGSAVAADPADSGGDP